MQEGMSPRSFLYSELRARQERNPAYSLRAFAQSLGVSPGRLSQYLSGKRPVTAAAARRVAERLNLSPAQEMEWNRPEAEDVLYRRLDEEAFRVIADWEHFALLSLIRLRGLDHKHATLARRLGVPLKVVDEAMGRLLELGLVTLRKGRYRRTAERLRSSDGVASRALRISHLQDLQRAMGALEEVGLDERDITSITMPIAKKRLPEAKARIKAFRRELAELLEGADADEVYSLQVQLVPVTKTEKREV